MIIYLGADHRGFQLKESIKEQLAQDGYEVVDCGNTTLDESDDYPDFASRVAQEVQKSPNDRRGIVICGSGVGVDIVANKFNRIRAGLALGTDHIYDARHDDDINVLALASDHVDPSAVKDIVNVFLNTPFGGEERFKRRIDKIEHSGI